MARHSKFTSAELIEWPFAFSSGSKSQTVLPLSTDPGALIAPALASRASASVVLPEPPWPTSATVRMASDAYFAIRRSSPFQMTELKCLLIFPDPRDTSHYPWRHSRRRGNPVSCNEYHRVPDFVGTTKLCHPDM